MKRLIPLLVLLAGCTATPPVATTPSGTAPTTTAPTTVTTTSPRIDTARKLPDNPCRLLAAEDFEGPLVGEPQPYPGIPRSCAFREGTGADTDLVVVVEFTDAYVKPENSSSELLIGDGHTAVASFATGPGIVECTYLVAVNATESYKIIASLRNANSDQISMISLGKAQQAFKRLTK